MKKILMICVILKSLMACEEVVDGENLPYVEKLVIQGVLEAGKSVSRIKITRTLPPLEEYSLSNAEIYDAEVLIENDDKNYRLNYSYPGYYKNENLIIKSGHEYKITVKWKNLQAEATTIVPLPIEVDSIYYTEKRDPWEEGFKIYSVFAVFKPKKWSAYVGARDEIRIFPDTAFSRSYGDIAYRYADTNKAGKINILLYNYHAHNSESLPMNRAYVIEAYDEPFYDYFITRWEGSSGDVVFGFSGVNIRGNVKGNGIGLFVGMSETPFRY